MSKKLFVFEGRKTEDNIVKNLAQNFSEIFPDISDNENVKCAYFTTIYSLYKEVLEDEYLDLFMILKGKELNKKKLKDYKSSDFSEIYLFFDYDGHASNADDNKLLKMIEYFNNETEFGKIFISYPMVESLKYFSNTIDFQELKFEIKEGKNYKKIVNINCDKKYLDFNEFDKDIWLELIDVHLKKMNFIGNTDFSFPNNLIPQNEIFIKQLEKYINIDATVAVLSAFPIFIFDYYGYNFVSELIKENKK